LGHYAAADAIGPRTDSRPTSLIDSQEARSASEHSVGEDRRPVPAQETAPDVKQDTCTSSLHTTTTCAADTAQVLGQDAGAAGVRAISIKLAADDTGRVLQPACNGSDASLCWRTPAIAMVFVLEPLVF